MRVKMMMKPPVKVKSNHKKNHDNLPVFDLSPAGF
jgi:hypothetical protein